MGGGGGMGKEESGWILRIFLWRYCWPTVSNESGDRLDDWFPNNLLLDDFQVAWDALRTWHLANRGLAGFLLEAQLVSRCAVLGWAIRPQSQDLAVSASAPGSLPPQHWMVSQNAFCVEPNKYHCQSCGLSLLVRGEKRNLCVTLKSESKKKLWAVYFKPVLVGHQIMAN